MWWIIFFYVIPGIINTWLLPKFIEYNGGMDAVNEMMEPKVYTLKEVTAIMSFLPVLNVLSAIPLILWYICTPKS